jgi:hypothetical protein
MSRPRAFRVTAAIAGVVAVVALLAVRHVAGPRRTPAGQPPLVKLSAENFDRLRDAFNAHAGQTRILAMLSPT